MTQNLPRYSNKHLGVGRCFPLSPVDSIKLQRLHETTSCQLLVQSRCTFELSARLLRL